MSAIVFNPWVGNLFGIQSPKILILGESHYLDVGHFHPDVTINVVRNFGLREKGKLRFFTTIAKILSGQPYEWLSDEKSSEFWHKVAFYNFILSSVGISARIRLTEEMWQKSEAPFYTVINNLQPDIIVILGKELGSRIKHLEPSFSNNIFCYWTHPSTPKYFKKQESINSFKEAQSLFASKK
jgi:hypothetical protein